MNVVRKWLWIGTGLIFALFTASAMAAKPPKPPQGQDKSYGIEFLLPSKVVLPDGTLRDNPFYKPGGVPGDKVIEVPVTVVVYVKNESPPSTAASNIGSLTFDLAPSLVLVDAPTCPQAQCTVNGNTVVVTNISPPIQGQDVYPVTLHVNTCVVANEAFISNVNVFTGSQVFNGQPFTLFTSDKKFPPALTLSTRGDAYPFIEETTPTVTGISCGNISCGQSFTIGNLDPSNLGYRVVTGFRGLSADGTCGTSNLSYFVTNKLGVAIDGTYLETARSVHFVWPSDANATATPVFAYKVVKDVDDTGTDFGLGWKPKPSFSPVRLNANILHCNGYDPNRAEPTTLADLPLPKVLGVLTQDVKNNSKQLKVDTLGNAPPTVTSPGIPIIVDNERMLVTAIDNSGWSVTRTDPTPHFAGKNVASTPMPILDSTVPPPYVAGTPAEMCLVWTDGGSAWVIDGSDGWVAIGKF